MSHYDDTRLHPELLAEMDVVRQFSDEDLRAALVESYGGQTVPEALVNRSDDTVLNLALFRLMKRGGPTKPHDFAKAQRPSALAEWWNRLTAEQCSTASTMVAGSEITGVHLVLMAQTQFPITLWQLEQHQPTTYLVPDDVAEFIAERTRHDGPN